MSASSYDVPLLSRQIMDLPHENDDGSSFMRRLVEVLVSAGFPLWRTSYALITMHPELLWRTVQWHEGRDVVVRDQTHARLDDDFYKKSPVAIVRGQTESVHVPLVEGALAFPIADDLRAQGGTDYYVAGLPFANGQVGYVSLATKVEGGFSAAAIAALEAIRPFLARRLELESSYYGTRALLDVYLGRNASRRVMAGEFQRGKGEMLDVVIWFSDMRDFTALSDRSSAAEVVQTLDGYFDAVATAIADGGGEVLKFIGDAVLAIFPENDDPKSASRHALTAARAGLSSLALMNDARIAKGESPVAIGIALHRGRVMYGNIGARDRLDFTVISSAVNEASRLESLCKSLETSVALSEAFVKAAELPDVVDLGLHSLKGVKAALHVFTLEAFRLPRAPR